MRPLLIPAALSAAVLAMSSTPAAFAKTNSVGDSSGAATANVCALSVECTYVNYAHGKPSDVARRSGTLRDWSLNAGSVDGQVQLRVLRSLAHGRLKLVRSSSWETITTPGENTFPAHLTVRAGDVLALTNSTSGIYMSSAPAGRCVRYFDVSMPDGSAGTPSRIITQLHLLLSADVTS